MHAFRFPATERGAQSSIEAAHLVERLTPLQYFRGRSARFILVTVPFLAIFKRTFTDSLTTVCILAVF